MTEQPRWEEIYNTPRTIGGFAIAVNRMSVPGGWIYIHTFTRVRTFGRDDIYMSSAFVPDPQSPG
jgi:hypothetical protein